MKFLFPLLLLFVACASTGVVERDDDRENVECCKGQSYFAGYIKTKSRGYFHGDSGEYYAVAYKDHDFRDQVSEILREHDLKQAPVCIRAEFCGSVGGESGDLVNRVIEIRGGKSLELIDCPSD